LTQTALDQSLSSLAFEKELSINKLSTISNPSTAFLTYNQVFEPVMGALQPHLKY